MSGASEFGPLATAGKLRLLATLSRSRTKAFPEVIYLNTADYTQYAQRTFEAERATVERLGLTKRG